MFFSRPYTEQTTYPLTQVFNFRVLERKILQLVLNRLLFARFDLDLVHVDVFGPKSLQHPLFFTGHEEQESLSRALVPRCSTHSVDISLRILRTIDLNDPVHSGKVQPPGSNIGRKQDGVLRLCELVKCRKSRHLLLLPM